MKKVILISLTVAVVIGGIFIGNLFNEYTTFSGKPSFKLAEQQSLNSNVAFSDGSLSVKADKDRYDKFDIGYFQITNTSSKKLEFTEEWTVQYLKENGKWYDIIHHGLGFTTNTSTLSKEKITDMIAMGNYKVGKFRFTKKLTDQEGNIYYIGVPFQLKWFWQ
ncbi:hypothetical protein IHV12_03630 [Fictibacillus sp. 7GRE50]|uniref:immunoglobulin-like domain-containing protein n=1 Tax=Fictibacillus sp. 7GRE50 TaxID=2745878 RepID=UPI0018CE608F|nr:immunoglobulin-like domain-containing protein [Fictibacillus sp. 7GRE50]MBH0163988.1 hypothetical protein [Fictibacillus sp. 7GRE50]